MIHRISPRLQLSTMITLSGPRTRLIATPFSISGYATSDSLMCRNVADQAKEMLNHRGYIYTAKHEGWYSVSDETFYPQSQVQNSLDPSTGKKRMVSSLTIIASAIAHLQARFRSKRARRSSGRQKPTIISVSLPFRIVCLTCTRTDNRNSSRPANTGRKSFNLFPRACKICLFRDRRND